MARIQFSILLFISVVVIGTFGFMLIEHWSLLDAVYMTIITIGTVGFHEVRELSDAGRLFTMGMIVMGIGAVGYALGNVAAFFIEGRMMEMLRGKRMLKEITKLKNHVILCGYGHTGSEIAAQLKGSKVAFVIIDHDQERVNLALEQGYIAVCGDASNDEVLELCGVNRAQGIIVTLSDDAINVFTVLTARNMKRDLRIIARCGDEQSKKKLVSAGADNTVSPDSIAARRMATMVKHPEIMEFIEEMMGRGALGLRLEKLTLAKTSVLAHRRLAQSYIKRDTDGAMILAISKPDGMIVNPPGDTKLEPGDKFIAIGNDEQLGKLRKLMG